MDKGREDEALQILADVHGMGNKDDELVQIEYLEIKEQIALDQQSAKSYLDLLKPDVRRRVFLGMSEQMWSQLTGMMSPACFSLPRQRSGADLDLPNLPSSPLPHVRDSTTS